MIFSEDENDCAHFVMGIIHGEAANQPNYLRYISEHYPKTHVILTIYFMNLLFIILFYFSHLNSFSKKKKKKRLQKKNLVNKEMLKWFQFQSILNKLKKH